MEEWKECKLKDICDYGKDRIEVSSLDNSNYISTENMLPNRAGVTTATTLPTGELTPSFEIDDTLVSNIRPYFKKIWKATFSGGCSADVLVFKAKGNISKDYLYYVLADEEFFKYSMATSKGTKMPRGDKTSIMNYPVKLPPLSTQQKIAAILSSLDDKIELNNKININLEQQAQALFKNWFVDFEPFGGKMPEGWKVGKLSEYCNFQEGYVNPAQTHNEYFDGDVKWLRAVDINESFILNTSRTLTKCGFESAGKSAFLFKPGSIAISKSGTVGRLGIISDFMCGNRAVIGIELKEQQNLSYIHQYLKSRQTEFSDMAVGSVQKNLYVSILENLDIIIPSKEVLEKFVAICIPFYDQIKTNCVENNNLSSIRDTLLPKLMNGEIEVDGIIL